MHQPHASPSASSDDIFFDATEHALAARPRPVPRPAGSLLPYARSAPNAESENRGVEPPRAKSLDGPRWLQQHLDQHQPQRQQHSPDEAGQLQRQFSLSQPYPIPRRYEVAADIFYAENAPDTEISIIKIAREVIGSVKQGADVTNVNLPASVLDPVSSLEKGMKSMQRGELLQLIAAAEDPTSRFLAVLRFYISGLSKEKFGKKPYNPILGETFRSCFLHRGGAGHTVLIAEQVSHHPPVTALSLCNETLGFRMNSFAAPEPRFWGNSVEVKLAGRIRIELDKFDEMYEITRPAIHMSGFLAGRHRLEFVGVASLTCEKLGIAAEVEFKAKGVLGRGDLNAVAGRVYNIVSGSTLYTIRGTWDTILSLTDAATGAESVLFDYAHILTEYSMCAILPPVGERESTFSSEVWAECSAAIRKADSAGANAAKRKVEDEQRAIRKARADRGKEYEYRYFEKRRDGDGYALLESTRAQLGPDVYLSEKDMEVIRRTQRLTDTTKGADSAVISTGKKKLFDLGWRK
jgi:oxysterol-binding protein-related protein 8